MASMKKKPSAMSAADAASSDGLENAVDAPASLPTPPVASVAEGAVKTLSDAILAAIERAIARLPEELRGNAFLIESVLTREFDKVNFTAWKQQAFAEVIAALQSGKSDVKHDPTELA